MKCLLNEYFRIFKNLSLFKIYNYLKLIISYYLSILFKKNINIALPYAISFEPTNICNLKCPECPSGSNNLSRKKTYADILLFQNIIDDVKSHCIYMNLYFQGEPFLNKDLIKMIDYANKAKIYTSVSTNGHFIDEYVAKEIIQAGLGRLIISLDGYSQETYEKYRRGGDFAKVIQSIKNIVHLRNSLKAKNPYIILQCLSLSTNEDELSKIKELGKELKADKVEIKTAQFYNLNVSNPLIPSSNKHLRYNKNKDGSLKIKSKLPNKCFLLWSSSVITCDAHVVPCCFDKDAKYAFGNIKENNFNTIWKSEAANNFRKGILKNRAKIDICTNCTQGLKI